MAALYVSDSSPTHNSPMLSLAIIFLLILIFIIIILVLYLVYWVPGPGLVTNCGSNADCGINRICSANVCVEIICSSDLDCEEGLCINSYCSASRCRIGNDCPTGTACTTSNQCISIGDKCQTNQDCRELSCMNGTCVQCLSDSNCPIGQGCFNQICRYPYDNETSSGSITYFSPARNNNNIIAPPGYLCTSVSCGAGLNNEDPIYCNGDTLCPSSCPFCVNSVCRCTIGANSEECASNSDCQSNICSNNLCVPGECSLNYNGNTGLGSCHVSKPYCVNGTCSTTSLGAICGSSNLPYDLCNNPPGGAGPTGITPNGMGFFCVNGFCSTHPGQLNNLCTVGSCQPGGILQCVETHPSTFTIPQLRCLT